MSARAGVWFTSSYSNAGNGCVQVRFDGADVLVADSKQRGAGPVIRVSRAGWAAFVDSALGAPAGPGRPRAAVDAAGGCRVTGPDGTVLDFTPTEWTAFLAGATDGEFTPVAA